MPVRIDVLARELGLPVGALLAHLQANGKRGFTSASQKLNDSDVALLRVRPPALLVTSGTHTHVGVSRNAPAAPRGAVITDRLDVAFGLTPEEAVVEDFGDETAWRALTAQLSPLTAGKSPSNQGSGPRKTVAQAAPPARVPSPPDTPVAASPPSPAAPRPGGVAGGHSPPPHEPKFPAASSPPASTRMQTRGTGLDSLAGLTVAPSPAAPPVVRPPPAPKHKGTLSAADLLDGLSSIGPTPTAKLPAAKPPPHAPVGTSPGRLFVTASTTGSTLADELQARAGALQTALDRAETRQRDGDSERKRLVAEIDALRTRLTTSEASATQHAATASDLRAHLAGIEGDLSLATKLARMTQERLDHAEAAHAGVCTELDTLHAQRPATTLRSLIDERGLVGAVELHAALVGLAASHLAEQLLDIVRVSNPAEVAGFLSDKVALRGPDEAPAPGVRVTVTVSADRSELDPPNLKAIQHFSSVCLATQRLRIVIVGGTPAAQRTFRQFVDPRLEVHFLEGHRTPHPSLLRADYTFVWLSGRVDHAVSEHFPDALRIRERGLRRMLEVAAEHIQRHTEAQLG